MCEREAEHMAYVLVNHGLYKKYKTFSVLIYSYINTSGNWQNDIAFEFSAAGNFSC